MRVAVTYDNGLVGQHFGRTEQFKLFDIEDGKLVSQQMLTNGGQGHGALAGVLLQGQVDVLSCGGIGMGARMALDEAGIELIPGVTGDIDEVIQQYLENNLQFNPDETCDHHEHGGDHECHHEGGCEGHCH